MALSGCLETADGEMVHLVPASMSAQPTTDNRRLKPAKDYVSAQDASLTFASLSGGSELVAGIEGEINVTFNWTESRPTSMSGRLSY